MNGIRPAVLALALSGAAIATPALASALEECVPAGDGAAVLRCLTEEDTRANVELSNAEAAAAKRARELEQATGRAGAHAALAKAEIVSAQLAETRIEFARDYASHKDLAAAEVRYAAALDSLRTELRGMNERLDRIIERFAQQA